MSNTRIGRRSVLAAAGLGLGGGPFAWAASGRPRVAIRTGHGVIVVELAADKAPIVTAPIVTTMANVRAGVGTGAGAVGRILVKGIFRKFT